MASLPSFTQFCSLHRWQSNLPSLSSINFVQFPDVRLRSTFAITAVRRKKAAENPSDGEEDDSEKKTPRKRAPTRRRKKTELEVSEESQIVESSISNMDEGTSLPSESAKPEKPQRRTRKKETAVASTSSSLDEEPEKKVTRRRRTKKKIEETTYEGSETELSEPEEDTDNEKDLELDAIDGNDISFTYAWPPLVCCFGPIQHAFVPSGRQANRLIDHESHERMKDALWTPEKFVRAPGGCAADVALCLARFGSNAAVMGKIGDDDFGQALLYHLNESRVQTRSVRIDPKRTTAVSRMKMSKRGNLKMTSITPCAEDGLKKSEINIDVLKEAKFFYFNSFSLLDRKTRTSALQAIKISKQFGGVIFFDVNLPLPLWHSREETLSIIQEALELADIIEVTKQELEFLCGIEPSERFDTKDNDKSKFVHYDPDVIAPVLHDDLELLFVTNGTSKIHYYTKTHNGSVLGTEDVPITPFTSDMSASGNGIVAGLMSKLIVQPHLMTDKEYLVHSINYSINRGVSEQWMQARTRGYPPKPGMEDDEFFPDPNGFKTITEKAYRTLFPIESDDSEDVNITINRHEGDDSEEEDDVNVERHDDYDSEDIGDTELDDEEPVRKVRSAIGA
uniref:fructokinase-like 2, chloroplastic n=1 Tax=Erigeron canadensis TaxID=72917 RepID=UPI001CB902A9|nr:fructokinase-like 2, chloroplastic [Erigeron canadensis]